MSARGNRRGNYSYQQQHYNQRGGQGSLMSSFPTMPAQNNRAPLIANNPPSMILPAFARGTPQIHQQFIYPPAAFPGQRPTLPGQYGIHQNYPPMHPNAPYIPMQQTNPAAAQVMPSSGHFGGGGAKVPNSVGYQPQTQTQYTSQKKRSNAIKIVDPDTHKEVKVDDSPSSSITSSKSAPTQPPGVSTAKNNVAAEFQSKVQGTLNMSEPSHRPNAIISVPSNNRTTESVTMNGDTSVTNVTPNIATERTSNEPDLTPLVEKPDLTNKSTSMSLDDNKNKNVIIVESDSASISLSPTVTMSADNSVTVKTTSENVDKVESKNKDDSTDVTDHTIKTDSIIKGNSTSKSVSDSEGDSKTKSLEMDNKRMPTQTPIAPTSETSSTTVASRDVAEHPSVPVSSLAKNEKKPDSQLDSLKEEKEKKETTKPKVLTKDERPTSADKQRKKTSTDKTELPKKADLQPPVKDRSLHASPDRGHLSLPSDTVTESTDGAELEEGEIPPGDDDDDITSQNGDERVVICPGNEHDHDQRKYDRSFLLIYKNMATDPPAELRNIIDLFCPDIVGLPAGFRKTSRAVKKIDYKPQAMEKVELHKAEVRWVRPSEQAIPGQEKQMQELFRKFQGILNKLTPQKFSDLAQKALNLEIDTEDKLHGCIDKIFEKALEEPNFSIAYANLCRVLSNIKVQVTKPADDGSDSKVVKETSFRRELLTKCQKEFEKDKKDDVTREQHLQAIEEATSEEEKSKKQTEFDEWETVARRRSLGNIRFIGELFKLKMLSEGIMHDCIQRLLRSTSDQESLECFSRLITTTGKELDHEKAKERMDKYFERVAQIIDKKKIPSRIKFMLQDVQDLRKCDWVPRRQEGLKTIDQIHREAKIEELAEQAMIKNMTSFNPNKYTREDRKKGSKQDDTGARRYEKKSTDVNKILGLRKREGTGSSSSNSLTNLRPQWDKRKDGQTPPPGEKQKHVPPKVAPQKSNSGGSRRPPPNVSGSGRTIIVQGGPRRSSSQPNENEKEKASVVEILKGMTNKPTTVQQPVKKVTMDKLDEETIRRKTRTIVDELTEIRDFEEAVACVIELESPNLMNVFVSESVLHSLEKSSNHREYAGRLLEHLFTKNMLTRENINSGLNEIIEMIDDLEVDIPKIWDFFAEIICPLFACHCLTLKDYVDLLNQYNLGYKAHRGVARVLYQCSVRKSKDVTIEMWKKSGLSWTSIGLDCDEKEFLDCEKLQFLSEIPSVDDPPYFKDLEVMFGTHDTTNDDILNWIEKQKIKARDVVFITSLSKASLLSNCQGKGGNCIFHDENFRARLPIVKKYVDENEDFQIGVLYSMQFTVELLEHPPDMLSSVFWSLYDVEVVSEKSCVNWRDKCKDAVGSGMALQTSKRFFDWLENADAESEG